MKNNRIIKNNSRFTRSSDLFSPTSTSRNQIQLVQVSDREVITVTPPNNENMLHNMKVKFLLNDLIKKLRYLSPPYKVPKNINEQWQSSTDADDEQNEKRNDGFKQSMSQQMVHRFQTFKHLNLLEGIFIIIFCWIVTVSIVYQNKIGFQLLIVTMILAISRIIFLSTFAILQKDKQNTAFLLNVYQDLATPALLAVTSALFIVRYCFQLGIGQHFIQFLSFITVIIQFKQIQTNFQNVVKWAQHSRMKKQLRIFELFLLIITLAHFFSLIMYAMSYISPNGQTWLKKASIHQQQWFVQYIYCFYWAITTTVTVGYGDMTPSNYYQVLVITCIELIGTAVFGYMINVIGITVDQIKKKNQQFDNYQETIDKLGEHYKLSRQLCHKMKHDIKQKQHEFKSIPLKTSQQKDFLEYIQPSLKQQFVLETNMKVIKKSIFFLTHFSVNFQNQVALKLIRFIYKPDEELLIQDQQKQRSIIIINSGCVDIYVEKTHNNYNLLKKVRQIKPSQESLAMNVFGYSSLVMNKNIKIKAIAQQTAVSYVLRRKDFLQCIAKSMLDFESFNEMRQKMMMYRILEEVQAPSIKQYERHFIPNIFLIQKKIQYQNQSRSFYYRSGRKQKTNVVPPKKQNHTFKILDEGSIIINEDEDFKSLQSFASTQFTTDHPLDLKELHYIGQLRMDQYKSFQNFMKSSNITIVAKNYQKACMKKIYRKRMRTQKIVKSSQMLINNLSLQSKFQQI